MSGKIALINPNLVLHASDLFTTGIVYMPAGLAYFSGTLKSHDYPLTVIDAFGEAPNQWFEANDLIFRGLKPQEVSQKIPENTKVACLYAINITYHQATLNIIRQLRSDHPSLSILVLENSQAVTGYSLNQVQKEFYDAGANFIVTSDLEERGAALIEALFSENPDEKIEQIDGIGYPKGNDVVYRPAKNQIKDLDALAFPAWEEFPLENYWQLRYSHAPFHSKRYLPVLTSRGCPYPCNFCVIPETNSRKWRGRSGTSVANEFAYLKDKFGVTEFHVEDVDPTVNNQRTHDICHALIDQKLNVTWKLGSGTKVETIKDVETVKLMAKAGCRYISISPESGSEKVMKLINKPFNIRHAVNLIHAMNREGIYSQACFVLGFPGEEDEDRKKTLNLIKELTAKGIDEIALFIITPIPGSNIFSDFSGYDQYSDLTFSPTWRNDYAKLNSWRIKMYRSFLIHKLFRHPFKLLAQPFRFLFRHFETKMEMAPYRAFHTYLLKSGLKGTKAA